MITDSRNYEIKVFVHLTKHIFQGNYGPSSWEKKYNITSNYCLILALKS